MFLHLPHMAADRLPALDLPAVLVWQAATHVIAAIPLKPAARIVRINPAFAFPFRQRLARIHAEKIAARIAASRRQLRAGKPATGKFAPAVGHVLAAEHAEPEHLSRRQLRLEFRVKATSRRRAQHVAIALLHLVVDDDDTLAHRRNYLGLLALRNRHAGHVSRALLP